MNPYAAPGMTPSSDPIAAACAVVGTDRAEVLSKSRRGDLVLTRYIAAWVYRQRYPFMPLASIGREIGGRDHATALHGIRRMNDMISLYPKIARVAHQALFLTNTTNTTNESTH